MRFLDSILKMDKIKLVLLFVCFLIINGFTQTQNKPGNNSLDITGAWHGYYHSTRGKGQWAWVIKKSTNGYTGILTTTQPYNGQNVPISVTLNGNKITVGWVAVGVVFKGTVMGNKMSGTWKFMNGMDSGKWEGEKGECAITPKKTPNSSQDTQGFPAIPQEGSALSALLHNAIGIPEVLPKQNASSSHNNTKIEAGGKEAQQLDKELKSSLIEIFGEAKLTRSNSVGYGAHKVIGLNYTINRPIARDDYDKLKKMVVNSGYHIISEEINHESNELKIVSKNDKDMLILTATIGQKHINFSLIPNQ